MKMKPPRRLPLVGLFLLVSLFGMNSAQAVLFYDDVPSSYHRDAPTGDYANSGWQYEGVFGGYLGTMISPNCFITSAHFGVQSTQFMSNGLFNGVSDVTYNIDTSANGGTGYWDVAGTDLRIYRVNGTFPNYAPLYSGSDEVGKQIVMTGRGGPRGAAIYLGSTLKGWETSSPDGWARWGLNTVSGTLSYGGASLLAADFNAVAGESYISAGDSGGGVFIQEGGVWKLAGISSYIDQYSRDGSVAATGALFDAGGFYLAPPGAATWQYIPDTVADRPDSLYASRISTSLATIGTITTAAAVPEPATIGLLASGLLAGLLWSLRRRLFG